MKKEIAFAPANKIEDFRTEVDELLHHFAEMMKEPDESEEDWVAFTFISDESCIGDFIYLEPDLAELRGRLGIPDVATRDSIVDVAALLRSKNRPQ